MVSGMWNACEVETGLKQLHQCAEKDLHMFIEAGNTTTLMTSAVD